MIFSAREILIIGNGGIAKSKSGIFFANKDTCDFIKDLQNNGYKVFYCDHYGDIEKNPSLYTYNLKQNNIKFSIIPGKRPKAYWGIFKLFVYILAFRNVYIFYPGGMSKTASRISIICHKKYGVYVRGYGLYLADKLNSANNSTFSFNDPFILENASYLITVSDGLGKKLEKFHSRISVIRPMTNWTLDDIYERKSKGKKFWNLLFVGSIIELKGISELIDIGRLLIEKKVNFKMNIIGDGNLLDEFMLQRENGVIPEEINFLGAIIDKKKLETYYEISDLFVFPSRNEGFPRVLYEAMLKNLPVFTTMVGGIPGLMVHNYNCIEMPVRDPVGQANAIIDGIKKPNLLNEIAKNGLITVKDVLVQRRPHYEVLISNLLHT